MKAIWDEILKVAVANKKSVGQFWSNGNEATAAYLVKWLHHWPKLGRNRRCSD